MAEVKQLQSIFPDLPRESPVVDKHGDFTQLWGLGFSALFQALQANYKNEGIIIPPLTAANMTTIQNLYTSFIGLTYNELALALPDISGQTVFDTDTYFTNQFVIAVDGSTPALVTLAEWVPLNVMISGSGDPNGTQAGVLNWMYFDSAGKILYACTTAGPIGVGPGFAAWTPI